MLDWIPHLRKWGDSRKCAFGGEFISLMKGTFQGDALLFRIISVTRGRNAWEKCE